MRTYKINKISEIETSRLSDFYKKTYHKRYKSLTNNWHWWYRIGHSKFEPLILSIDNQVVGQAGLLPIDLKISEDKIPAICFVDFAILPEYQRKGFGEILTKEWMKICPNQITFCNEQSLKIFKKLGWKNNLSAKRFSKPINILRFLPISKKFKFNFIDKSLKYLIKRRYNYKKFILPKKINNNFGLIKDSFTKKKIIENDTFAEIIRDEQWLHWRLIECPYSKDIFFFEYNNTFAIVHIYKETDIKKLNILFTYSTDKTFEEEIILKIINWSINNDIDLVWMINRDTKFLNIFSKVLTKSINFASWSSDKKISLTLEKGLLDPQGIDSDIDSSLYIE